MSSLPTSMNFELSEPFEASKYLSTWEPMTKNRSCHSPEVANPSHHTRQVPSAAVAGSDEGADAVIVAILSDELRVIKIERQWVLQHRQRGAKKWQSLSFCATREGLITSIKERVLEEHLTRLGHDQVKKVQVPDENGRLKWKRIVTRESLDATEAARAALKRGDMTAFDISLAAWAIIESLPDYFPKHRAEVLRLLPHFPNLCRL